MVMLARGDFDRPKWAQKSCGCFKRSGLVDNGRRPKNIEGQRFGSLVVIDMVPDIRVAKCSVWRCQCDCGNACQVNAKKLAAGWCLNCGDKEHLPGSWYPPTPSPYPKEAGELLVKYLPLTKLRDSSRTDSAIEDEKMERLIRVAWIICYRRGQGEIINDRYERFYVQKHLRYSKIDVSLRRKLEKGGGLIYNTYGIKKEIGSVMTDLTSQNEAVLETQPDNLLPIPSGKRFRFKRC
jgi:hypothetical protein